MRKPRIEFKESFVKMKNIQNLKLTIYLHAIIAITFIASTSAAQAAVLNVFTQSTLGSTCDSQSASSGVANASCGSFATGDGIDARASYGDIGLRSQVIGSIFGEPSPGSNDFWRGGASIFDTLYFAEQTGVYRLFYDISANFVEQVTGSFFGSSINFARNTFNATVNSQVVFQRVNLYANNPTAVLVDTDDIGSTGSGFIDLTFNGGQLDLGIALFTEQNCGAQGALGSPNKTGTCRLGVDAYNSLRLIGSTVFDDSGNEIVNGLLGSDSGFNYTDGVAPHAEVPTPAALPLLLSAVGLLGFMRRRRKRKEPLLPGLNPSS